MAVDISSQALKVGNALSSVRIDELIVNLAKGLAWGQYDLDQVGTAVTKMMGVPGTVSIGDEQLSMLEAGFLPTFYQFVDTILELKMEIKIREEEVRTFKSRDTAFQSHSSERGGEVAGRGWRQHWRGQSKSAYSRTLDAGYSQKYNQELDASSLMRTKMVPKPPPDLLIERIRLILERMREEAERQARQEEVDNVDERIEELVFEKVTDRLMGRVVKAEP